jgi:sec-independent protein translocase protein TatC
LNGINTQAYYALEAFSLYNTSPAMPTASSSHPPRTDPQAKRPKNGEFDPDHYRMTIGEHLEELRSRLVRGIIGFVIVLIGCFVFYKDVVWFFCKPLVETLYSRHINPQLVVDDVGEGFMVVIKITMIVAAAFAAPWILYQLWQFVAAGLYPKERKYVTRYLPLSILLLIGGMVFVYMLVLPWTLQFFVDWNKALPLRMQSVVQIVEAKIPAANGAPAAPLLSVPSFPGDPANASDGALWFDSKTHQLKFALSGEAQVISFNSPNLVAQEYKLSNYMDMVVMMLITFGLSFQLPLVVLALERIGIMPIETLRSGRRMVYFAMVVIAAVITPGDVVTATLALIVPLIGLYELGILLARTGKPREDAAVA